MIRSEITKNLSAYSKLLWEKGWVANHDGNLSCRVGSTEILATPTAFSKREVGETDLVLCDLTGKKKSGRNEPFSELSYHLQVYKIRNDIQVVMHSHAPSLTAVGCAGLEIATTAISEAVVSLGPGIPLVESNLSEAARHYDVVMMAANGVFSWGKDFEQAFLRMELAEHLAKIFLQTTFIGGPKILTPEQVKILLEKRKKAGLSLPADPQRPEWFVSEF